MSRVVRFASLVVLAAAGACSDRAASPASPSAVQTDIAARPDGAPPLPVASAPASTQPAAKYEQDFLTGMIDHHQMAVEMAETCVEKAVHAELRSLCENIIATQSAEIQQMQSWLQDWYGTSYSPRMNPGAMNQMERLASLSGAEYEIAFMETMIRHHRGAVQEARTCVRRAYHDELVQLCHDIIAAQTAEIEQMENWLCDWYGRC